MAVDLSVAAPAFNEAAGIAETVTGWGKYLDGHPKVGNWEIVVCNDGSTDDTAAILATLRADCPQLRVVEFDHNRGAGAAIAAAIAHTRLEWVVLLDSDGQFPITNLDQFLARVLAGEARAFSGARLRKADSLPYRWGSAASGAVSNLFHRTHYRDYNSIFKLVHGPLFRSLPLESGGMNCSTEITARITELGHTWVEIPIEHQPRRSGRRGWRFWRGAYDRALFVGYLGYRRWLLRRGVLRRPLPEQGAPTQPGGFVGAPSSAPGAAVTLFAGGSGSASLARELLRTPGIELSLIVNGYDNGLSTGTLRRFLPGMLGPADFRKNLLLHLDGGDPAEAALGAVLRYRLPAGAGRHDLDELVAALATPGVGPFAALAAPVRAAVLADLEAFQHRLDQHRDGVELAGCALGNLVLAGAYLRLGDFNAAVDACAHTFGSPARLLNVTNGENAYLVALKHDGQLLADEADIVGPQDRTAISDLFLLREPLTARQRADLAGQPVPRQRQRLAELAAPVSLNPHARDAITQADLLIYGPGTPHSSLLPSYLTPGVAGAVAASRARAKVFVVNLGEDNDVQGRSAPELVDLTLAYLGDPLNQQRTVTHILSQPCPGAPAVPAEVAGRGSWAGAQWITSDLVDPHRPGQHDGARTLSALTRITDPATLVGR